MKNIIMILLMLLLPINTVLFRNDGFLAYICSILLPFIIFIVLQFLDVQHSYLDYVYDTEKEKNCYCNLSAMIAGSNITKAFLKWKTPYVERLHIRMITSGCHSIHAAPYIYV